jgi:hypothetical protein
MVHRHLSWLVYPFDKLKTGAAIASLVLFSVRAPLSLPRTHHGGSVTSLLRLLPQAPAGSSGS